MKKLPLFIIVAAILLSFPISMRGQLDLDLDPARHIEYRRSIKQFSEFVDRFNQDFYEVPNLDPNCSLVLDRKQSILLLFNRDDLRFDLSSPEYSKEYVELVLKFADDIVENDIYLDKHSDQIKAVVTTSVLYRGEPDTMRIILTQEVDAPNLVRWVISDVEADFLEIPERDTVQMRFLSPVSHELGFMDLKKVFGEPGHVIDYTREDFKYDRLCVFLHVVKGGSIEVEEVIRLVFDLNVEGRYKLKIEETLNYLTIAYTIVELGISSSPEK